MWESIWDIDYLENLGSGRGGGVFINPVPTLLGMQPHCHHSSFNCLSSCQRWLFKEALINGLPRETFELEEHRGLSISARYGRPARMDSDSALDMKQQGYDEHSSLFCESPLLPRTQTCKTHTGTKDVLCSLKKNGCVGHY